MSSWIGAAITGVGSLLGSIGQGRNIDKQIRAQQEENRKNREYNFMLAQQQNKWSVEQWERENEYNSPKNQMARLKEGGIHPGLAYTNGVHNISASSPSMTAGAPGTPADMSALGQKPTLGQAIQMALASEATRAQIDNIKADTRKTLADAGLNENDLKYRDALNAIGLSIQTHEDNLKSQQAAAFVEQYEKLKVERKQAEVSLQSMKLDKFRKEIENSFREDEMKYILKKLENEAKISEQEAKFAVENYANRLLFSSSQAGIMEDQAAIPKFLENLKDKNQLGKVGATLLQAVRYVLGFINPLVK